MHIHTMIPPARLAAHASRGALVAADLFNRALVYFAHLWSSHDVVSAEPQSTRARESAEARRIANTLRGTDRRLADELFAAADWHEREDR